MDNEMTHRILTALLDADADVHCASTVTGATAFDLVAYDGDLSSTTVLAIEEQTTTVCQNQLCVLTEEEMQRFDEISLRTSTEKVQPMA